MEPNVNRVNQEYTFLDRPTLVMICLLSTLSLVSGFLLSKASLVGRTGINLFYKEYRFLKVWWQGATLVFVALSVLFFVQGLVHEKMSPVTARVVQVTLLGVGLAGLFITYLDFTNTSAHRLLGEKFHLGAYLFWISWMIISLYYLFLKRRKAFT